MRPTGSKLWLLQHCQWPFRSDVKAPDDVPNEASATGKLFHSMAECEKTGGEPEAFDLADPKRAAAMMKTMKKWPLWAELMKPVFVPEVTLLYDWVTGDTRRMPPGWTKTKRERGENELAIVIDLLDDSSPVPRIYDYKTGKHSKKEKAEGSAQLKVAGLALAREIGCTEVEGGLVHVRQQLPSVALDATPYDAMELLEFEDGVKHHLSIAQDAEPQLGDWCFRCPVKTICPAMQSMAREPDAPDDYYDNLIATNVNAA